MFKKGLLSIAVMATFLTAGFAQNPDEWPIQHNIHHTAHSLSTTIKPPFKTKWMTKVQGNFQGVGPVVAEGKLVTQDNHGHLFCLDAHTGELLWRYFVKSAGGHHSSPCIWNSRVYANFFCKGWPDILGMRCLDLKTGELLWKGTGGFSIPRNHYSPQVTNGKLFFACVRDNNESLYSDPNYDWQAQVLAWDAVTGDSLWTYTLFTGVEDSYAGRIGCNTSILAVNDTVYASYSYKPNGTGKTVALDLDGNVLWSSTQHHISSYVGQLQYYPGKLIIMAAGNSNAVKILSTADWSVLLNGGGGNEYSKINAFMNGKYWNRGYSDVARAYDATTGQFLYAAKTFNGEGFRTGCAPIVTANGYVIQGFGSAGNTAGDNGHKWYAYKEDGTPVWSYQSSNNVCNPMAIAYGNLYTVEGGDPLVYCFENE
jgi:outer membrane protein assembly factor BamB